MSEQSVYDTFTYTATCGCVVYVERGKETPHACTAEGASDA